MIIKNDQTYKQDYQKPVLTRVPVEILEAVSHVREYGCKKYGDNDNWKSVDPQRYWEALLRHVTAAWDDFEAVDDESGLMHIEHVACNLAFILALTHPRGTHRSK